MNKVLVTGGTGLLGSHLLFYLLSANKKVKALKTAKSDINQVETVFSYYTSLSKELFDKIEWVDGDVTDIFSLLDALEGVEHVYHCAGMVSFNKKEADLLWTVNVEGTANLVNACIEKQITKFCHVSSVASLPNSENGSIITEDAKWKKNPSGANYGNSKYVSENEVWRGIEEGLDSIIVNPSIIVGSGNWNKSSAAMFKAANKGIKFYTEGAAGFVDVRDVAQCMIKLMDSTMVNERYIVSAENSSYKSFFEMLHTSLHKPLPQLKAGYFLLSLGILGSKLKSIVMGSTQTITKEITKSAQQKNYYSSSKLLKTINHTFVPLRESIEVAASNFFKNK